MTEQNKRYNLLELMVCTAAHQLEDGKTAVIGTGMPLAAAMLAQKTTAPNLVIMFEAGAVATQLQKLPISVADSYTQTGALLHSSMDVIMESCQRGLVGRHHADSNRLLPYRGAQVRWHRCGRG